MTAIDLNRLHRALHQVTSDMAVKFNRATVDDLALWIKALRVIAKAMEAAMRQEGNEAKTDGGSGATA
jgi:hypothetical protein